MTPSTKEFHGGAPGHRFDIGQCVRLTGGFGTSQIPADVCRISARLAPVGDAQQYRVRHEDERRERMIAQDMIEPNDVSNSKADRSVRESIRADGGQAEGGRPGRPRP